MMDFLPFVKFKWLMRVFNRCDCHLQKAIEDWGRTILFLGWFNKISKFTHINRKISEYDLHCAHIIRSVRNTIFLNILLKIKTIYFDSLQRDFIIVCRFSDRPTSSWRSPYLYPALRFVFLQFRELKITVLRSEFREEDILLAFFCSCSHPHLPCGSLVGSWNAVPPFRVGLFLDLQTPAYLGAVIVISFFSTLQVKTVMFSLDLCLMIF